MGDFITLLTNFYVSLFSCSVFLYFLAAFLFYAIVLIILRIVKG